MGCVPFLLKKLIGRQFVLLKKMAKVLGYVNTKHCMKSFFWCKTPNKG